MLPPANVLLEEAAVSILRPGHSPGSAQDRRMPFSYYRVLKSPWACSLMPPLPKSPATPLLPVSLGLFPNLHKTSLALTQSSVSANVLYDLCTSVLWVELLN